MTKEQVLKSLPTFKLLAWEQTADTSGGGKYVHFDSSKNATAIYTLDAIRAELGRRDDNPNRQSGKKNKK